MPSAAKDARGALVERLCRAVNEHDLDALTECFAEDYRNETPAHPARSFRGRLQARRNWEQIFGGVPDITADVRWIADEEAVWSEWEMRGRRRDGVRHHMRGVVIFGVEGDVATWARFYLEPVQEGGGDADEAIRRAVLSNPDPAAARGDAERAP